MPRRVTSSDGGGRLDILLSLRIGGGACPAGGVGDFTTCLLLGACTLSINNAPAGIREIPNRE